MFLIQHLLKKLGLTDDPALRKHALDVELERALVDLAEQQQRSPDDMASDLLQEALARRQLDFDLWRRWQSLSPREQQVAALACLDYTNPQIAARLGLSVETVRTHMRNVHAKFHVTSKARLRFLLSGWDFSDWDQNIS